MTGLAAAPDVPPAVATLFDPDLRRWLVELRRAIHSDPELSFQEERTAQKLERALAALNDATIRRVAKTGVVARVRGRDSSLPLVAIRGDIDALPVREETGLPFASHNEGVMHACGHDVHATWAVGAAALLAQRPAAGDVLVVFETSTPAAETTPKNTEAVGFTYQKKSWDVGIFEKRVGTMYNDNSNNSGLVAQKRYLKSVPVNERSPEALVKGWDQALQQIVAALAADLNSMNLNSRNSTPPASPGKDTSDAAESR